MLKLLPPLFFVLASGAILWVLAERTVPRMQASANEEMVADWREGLNQRFHETGTWPRQDIYSNFVDDVMALRGADGRMIRGGYMHGRPSRNSGTAMVDIYDTPLRFTFGKDSVRVVSAGENRQFDDADDVTSDNARDRYTPATLADARAKAEEIVRKAEAQKSGATPAPKP